MALHRLEVYLESYDTEPFIREYPDALNLSPLDENQLARWISESTGRDIQIDRDVKIADVRHHTVCELEATSLKLQIIN